MTVFNRKEVEALVLLRDGANKTIEGATMLLDGLNKLLDTTEPETRPQYDISKVKTVQAEGPSGHYKKTINQDGDDYKLLLEDLKAHDGKLTKNGLFVWLFSDKKTVGMKLSNR